jgi:hypothetical protein
LALASTLLLSVFLVAVEIIRESYYSDCTVSDSVYGTTLLLILSLFKPTALLIVPFVFFAGLPGYFGLKRALQVETTFIVLALIWLIVDVAMQHPAGLACLRSSNL